MRKADAAGVREASGSGITSSPAVLSVFSPSAVSAAQSSTPSGGAVIPALAVPRFIFLSA